MQALCGAAFDAFWASRATVVVAASWEEGNKKRRMWDMYRGSKKSREAMLPAGAGTR